MRIGNVAYIAPNIFGVVNGRPFGIISVTEFGAVGNGSADDTSAIQAALNAARDAGGGIVHIPAGIYPITSALKIYSRTHLRLDPNATILRSAAIDNMLRNGTENVGGYDGDTDIVVEGGTWDANKDAFPSNVCALAFGHARNIAIRDCTIRNVYGWHHLELNAVKDARVLNCAFLDFDASSTNTEMLQIDLMGSPATWVWFGLYDGTPCKNILIQGCLFDNGPHGIGSHTAINGMKHSNIKVVHCHFRNLRQDCIHGFSWDDTLIEGCTFEDAFRGIYMTVSGEDIYNHTARNNLFINLRKNTQARAIHYQGTSTSFIHNVIVSGNAIRGVGRHGIGVDWGMDVSIVGNSVSECDRVGLWVWKCKRATVQGNVLFNNGSESPGWEDLSIGDYASPSTDTEDVVVAGNTCEWLRVRYSNRVIIHGNIITQMLTVNDSEALECKRFNNFVAGIWTP